MPRDGTLEHLPGADVCTSCVLLHVHSYLCISLHVPGRLRLLCARASAGPGLSLLAVEGLWCEQTAGTSGDCVEPPRDGTSELRAHRH